MSQADLGQLLTRYSKAAGTSPFGISYHAAFSGSGQRSEHLLIGFVTHGNERGTLPAAVRLAEELSSGKLRSAGPVSLLLGNVEACRKNVRFVEEDLNRVFTFDAPANSLERRRADEIRPLLDSVDFFLDLHQTQTPTESAFWTFPWISELGQWAQAIGAAPLGLTRRNAGSFSQGRCCLDEYVRACGKLAATIEMGEKGWDDAQAEAAYQACVRLIQGYDAVTTGKHTLSELADERAAIQWFSTQDIVPAQTSRHRLRPGIGNWKKVEKGEILSAAGGPEIRASNDGRVLFPKYFKDGEPLPPELFRLGVRIEDPELEFLGAS